ncbi:MAG: hypothetical protein IJ759_05595 [Bacteroidales bacterium]|nr:hypothetical protein [Bacteroidales bacterium]
MKNIRIILAIVVIICFCACGKKENKQIRKEQNISNKDSTKYNIDTTAYNISSEFDSIMAEFDSRIDLRNKSWDYLFDEFIETDRATTLIKDVKEAEAKIPDFKNMYDAESWLLKNFKTDKSWQCEGAIINFELFFAILNKYPKQTMEYPFDRLLKKYYYEYSDNNIKITTTDDRRLKCYAIHVPWTRITDVEVILYTQYINDSDSICHRLGYSEYNINNVRIFKNNDKTIYVAERLNPYYQTLSCGYLFKSSIIAVSISDSLQYEYVFPNKENKRTYYLTNDYCAHFREITCCYYDEEDSSYYIPIEWSVCPEYGKDSTHQLKYDYYKWNGKTFDRSVRVSKKYKNKSATIM